MKSFNLPNEIINDKLKSLANYYIENLNKQQKIYWELSRREGRKKGERVSNI